MSHLRYIFPGAALLEASSRTSIIRRRRILNHLHMIRLEPVTKTWLALPTVWLALLYSLHRHTPLFISTIKLVKMSVTPPRDPRVRQTGVVAEDVPEGYCDSDYSGPTVPSTPETALHDNKSGTPFSPLTMTRKLNHLL
jgi:hypothetical protein